MNGSRVILVTLVLGAMIVGCGTTHHFLPPRPLEKGEAMISIAWHYDFGQLHAVDILPDGNFYFGVGKDYNMGFAMKIPMISINHFTTARYWNEGEDNYSAAFFHINQIMGPNNNPYFEAGGAYFKWDESFNQSFILGLGLGTGVVDPLVNLRPRSRHEETFDRHLRLMPFAKYAVAGSEVGLSVSYYHGINASGVNHLIKTFYEDNDTVLVVEGSSIDSISGEMNMDKHWGVTNNVYLNTGDTVELRRYLMCGTGQLMLASVVPWFEPSWYTTIGRFKSNELEYSLFTRELDHEIEVNVDLGRLRARVERGEDAVFWRFSEDLNERLLKRRETLKFWNDFSVGAAAIGYEKSDD